MLLRSRSMNGCLYRCFLLYAVLISSSLAIDDECPSGWFTCGNDRCVAGMWICDGEDDCGNNMDEVDCDNTESTKCERYQFECKDTSRCIPKTWVCDGHADCQDSSDEDCNNNQTEPCDGFRCKDNTCIPEKWKCDDSWDCKEGEDEDGCNVVAECRPEEFTCNNLSCISESKVCDGHADCSHGEDEGRHCNERLCRKLSCSHDCHVEPAGARCLCREGYQLAEDKTTCNDIDECKESNACSQRCINTKGSFVCSCIPGYNLVDNTSCEASGDEPLLIFSTTKEIRGMWIRKQRYFPIARSRYQALGVAFDGVDNRVYWVEVKLNGGRIMSCALDGTDVRVVLSTGLQQPEDVVIDWLARNMYITDAGLKQVLVCKLEGSYCHAVVKQAIDQPRAVVVDPRKRFLFWTDWGKRPGIFRAGMDGALRITLVESDVAWPNGLALDLPSNRLYWCDGKLMRFESIGLNGEGRILILAESSFHPFSLDVFEDSLYWSDWATYSIDSCHKTTGKNQTLLLRSSRSMVMGVHVYHPVLLSNERNPCWSSLCSHLCVLAVGGYSCACPAGYALDADRKTCLPVRSTPFLLAAEENHVWHIHPEAVGENIVTELPIGKITTVGGVAFDWDTKTIYLSDVHKGAIFAVDTMTYRMRPFISKHLDAVESMEFDWLGHNLYWVDAGTGLVEVAYTKNESTRSTLVKDLAHPMSLALLLEKGTMYIVTAGKNPTITECHMDGRSCKVLVSRGLGIPVSVTVEPSLGRVFWADAKLGTIESSDFEGQSRTKNQVRVGQVMSVSSSESTLYWTDIDQHLIHFTRHDASLGVVGTVKLPMDHNGSAIIRTAFLSPPPERKMGPCATMNGGCSHMCLTNPSGFTCFCPTGLILDATKKTCTAFLRSCDSNEFRCVNTSECIPAEFRCDGSPDCEDGSDEANCRESCPLGDFRCDNGKCLLSNWRCDGYQDCQDGSDESNCSQPDTCKATEFACNDGHCLSNLWRCDGERDCSEGEDEVDCEKQECDSVEFACRNGDCVPKSWVCDGDFDCRDKSDELDCGGITSCASGELKCGDGLCLDKNVLCDRHKDCEDGSDEKDCEYEIEGCPPDTFTCKDLMCIYSYEKCDGIKDCAKGEDETNCSYCKETEFYCQQRGRCIPSSWTCDGMDDCGDGEDESLPKCLIMLTTTKSTKECPEFSCESGDCVPWKRVCDDVPDCSDSSDEGSHCGTTCSTNNGGCGQKCRDTPRGPVCSCLEGYRLLTDGQTCDDVDECLVPGHCSQECINTKGGFKCVCIEGYMITADGRRCKAKHGVARLLYLLSEEVMGLTLEGQRKQLMLRGTETEMKALDLDVKDSTLFWTEKTGTINELSNGSVTTIATLDRPQFLAYDWIAGNIYYTTSLSIGACRRDGKYCCQIVKPDNFPQGLTLAPPEGLMFWSISYNNVNQKPGQIYRAPMDGGNGIGKPIPFKVDWPTCLTVDPVSRRLYWIDAALHTIEVSDLDGYNRETLISTSSHHPSGLAIFEDFIFWSDLKTRHIVRANKFNGGGTSQVAYVDAHPLTLKIMHPLVQPSVNNPCLKASCPHLCLIKERGYSCKCADRYSPWNNSKACIPSNKVDIHDGKLVTYKNCSVGACRNEGLCVETSEGTVRCECKPGFTGSKCDYSIPEDEVEPDYSLVAAVIIGSLAALVVVVIIVIMCRKYSRNIRSFGQTLQLTFPNPLFDLLPKSGRLVVENEEMGADDSTATKATGTKSRPEQFTSSTYVCNTEGPLRELYRGTSSESVDSAIINDKENLEKSLLPVGSRPVRYLKRL